MAPDPAIAHFAEPHWLWLLVVPAIVWWWPGRRRVAGEQARLGRYADPHLLPHLVQGALTREGAWRWLLVWAALWTCAVLAMAGPRFGYTDVRLYRPGANLLVLLDISRSMQVADVRPTRLARARQEVGDLIGHNPGMGLGLVAFASVAHVAAPITEDAETVRHLLPSISTDLARWQGSRLAAALDRAERLLAGQPKESRHALLLVSDGGFAEDDLEARVQRLAQAGVHFHVLGVGTLEGGPVPAPGRGAAPAGGWVQGNGATPVVSALEEERLQALASAGGGVYRRADYRDDDVRELLDAIAGDAALHDADDETQRVWHERYYLVVALMLILALVWYHRRGDAWSAP